MARDEEKVEIGIPFLRGMLKAAAARAARGSAGPVTVANPMRDCMPLSFAAEMLTPEAVQEALAKLDQMEAEVRARIAGTEQGTR